MLHFEIGLQMFTLLTYSAYQPVHCQIINSLLQFGLSQFYFQSPQYMKLEIGLFAHHCAIRGSRSSPLLPQQNPAPPLRTYAKYLCRRSGFLQTIITGYTAAYTRGRVNSAAPTWILWLGQQDSACYDEVSKNEI